MALAGHGGLIGIAGDAGLGKSALVERFIEDLSQSGNAFHLTRARCSESLTESEPFLPWIEAMGALARDSKANDLMQQAAPAWHREILHMGSGAARRMKREMLDFCIQFSAAYPMVIVIDDFHWADVASVDLLAFLATRLSASRTLVIVCYRLAEMKVASHDFLQVRADLLSQEAFTELRLKLLGRDDVAKYLAAVYPQSEFPGDFASFLYAKTEGNPLFLREYARHPDTLPEPLRQMIERKLNRLDDTHRQLLVTASVQGREFDSAVLARSMEISAEDIEETLTELDEEHGLIQRVREQELPDGKLTVRYRFAYDFYQEVCYQSLAPTRKASLNAAIAEAFLAYYGH